MSALDRRRVAVYSDLLLHDMGPTLADVCGPGARPSEVRTAPLMGLRYRELLRKEVQLPLVPVPYLFDRSFGPQAIEKVAHAIEEAL